MIQIQLTLTAHPGHGPHMLKALRSLALGLQTDGHREHGSVLRCAIYTEPATPEAICYVEEWAVTRELDQRVRSPAFLRLLAIMETAAAPPSLEFRFIDRVCGLDYVESLRLTAAGTSAGNG